MNIRTTVAVATRVDAYDDPDDALVGEYRAWGVFGTITGQHLDRATASTVTTVKVGPAGRRALEGALRARPQSRLTTPGGAA